MGYRAGCSPFGFFFLIVTWVVAFDLILVESSASKGGFTSEWVDNVGTTDGGENSHLSSLRNTWGNVGVLLVGY